MKSFSAVIRGKAPLIISGILLVLLLVRSLLFFLLPESAIIGWVADDSFYYQKLACNFSREGRWTFDGTTSTTGFHLLYAYLLSLLNWLLGCGSWRISFFVISFLASASIAYACFVTLKIILKLYGASASIVASLAYFSPLVFLQVTTLLESWLSILVSALIFYAALSGAPPNCPRYPASYSVADLRRLSPPAVYLLFLGLLSSLSRTDAIAYTVVLALLGWLFLFLSWRLRQRLEWHRTLSLKLTTIFIGSAIGNLLAIGHNLVTSGSLIQSSGATKYFWSALAGHSPKPMIGLLFELVTYPFSGIVYLTKYGIAAFVAASTIALIARCIKSKAYIYSFLDPPMVFLGISFAVVTTYVIAYSFNSQALQPWYICQVLIPVSILIGGLWRYVFGSNQGLLAYSFLIFAIAVSQSTRLIAQSRWPHQLGMLNAGRHLLLSGENKKIGSWNSGIISFFSERPIINLDGLVNNQILPYLKRKSLFDYVKAKNIAYVVDYERMLTDAMKSKRGGYGDGSLSKCLQKLREIDGGAPGWRDSRLSIYRVKRDCR